MKFQTLVPKEVDIGFVGIQFPMDSFDDDQLEDLPKWMRGKGSFDIIVNIDNGYILGYANKDWEGGFEIYVKVVDRGTYYLYDYGLVKIAERRDWYVPHGVVPGEFGDYIELKISSEGRITNWPSKPDVRDFFEQAEGEDLGAPYYVLR